MPQKSPWFRLVIGLALLLTAFVVLVAFFPWDVLRGPLNRYVSERTGRHFEITRKLDVKLGRTTRILADGIEFANPPWARDPHLVKAESAEIEVRLIPLLRGRIELPLIALHKPQLGLQVEADGRRTWALGKDTSDKRNLPDIGVLVVDEGKAHFVADHQGADIRTEFAIERSNAPTTAAGTGTTALPLTFKARGTWQKENFSADGRTGNVLYLSAPLQRPFPAQVNATAGRTSLRANGSIASVATLDGADVAFNLQGANLADLYKLVGVVLPETPRYSVRGQLSKQGAVWHARQIDGKLGNSDLAGELAFDRSQAVPVLTGRLQSKALDFDDLAPLIGLPEQPRSAAALPQVAGAASRPLARTAVQAPGRKVLPTATLDVARLKAMNADVTYSAARITHTRQLPLERMSVHVVVRNGILQLDKMDLGVAGGRLGGRLRVDGNSSPAAAEVNLDARSLELNKLFPGFKMTKASFGKIHGDIDLKGRGNSVAQMLGAASGNVAMVMGGGQISNLLMEIAGLDGAEIIKFFTGGDQNILLRCAAAAFDVNLGLMTARALVLDTEDTVIYGSGAVSLASESMDLTLRPFPKDASILSLRSPLKVSGSFAAPKAGVDKAALASRAGLALALGAINPLLALAATIETGPGKDADCSAILRQAAAPHSAGSAATATFGKGQPPAASKSPVAPPAKPASGTAPHYPLEKPVRP